MSAPSRNAQAGLFLLAIATAAGGWFFWRSHAAADPRLARMQKAGCPQDDVDRARAGDPLEVNADELLKQQDQVDEAIFSLRDSASPEQVKAAVLRLIPLAVAGHADAAVELARTYDHAAESGDGSAKEQAIQWRCQAYRLGSPEF